MDGSYLTLILVAFLGGISLVSLGLMISARVTSEELAGGLLNLVNWPMMLLSGVWFSLGRRRPRYCRTWPRFFPLTHSLDAARAVMLDGAGIIDIAPNLITLVLMSAVFLALGAGSFRWNQG